MWSAGVHIVTHMLRVSQDLAERKKLGQVPVCAPLERVAVDILGLLQKTENGNEYIMVLTDYFTKWTDAYPQVNHTAQTVVNVMMEQFVSRFGIPRKFIPTKVENSNQNQLLNYANCWESKRPQPLPTTLSVMAW